MTTALFILISLIPALLSQPKPILPPPWTLNRRLCRLRRLRSRLLMQLRRRRLLLIHRILRRPTLIRSATLLLPLRLPHPLRVLPRPIITVLASALTFTIPTELLRQILRWYLSQNLALVPTTQHMNLRDGHRIQKPLDHTKGARESPRRVDDIQFPQAFRVVVLRNRGGGFDVSVDAGDLAYPDAFHVHDGAARLEEFACFAATGREAGVGDFFVLDHEVLEHAF
jgi:hypothetical protein